MKKIFSMALLATFIATMSSQALAINGTVRFQGEIITNACEISADSKDQLVILGKHAVSELMTSTETTDVNFRIKLVNCPKGLSSARVRFSGEIDPTNPDYLKVTSSGRTEAAKGVAIKLKDRNKQELKLHTNSIEYPISDGLAVMNFFASYVKTQNTVTAGEANGKADFSIIYN